MTSSLGDRGTMLFVNSLPPRENKISYVFFSFPPNFSAVKVSHTCTEHGGQGLSR